MARTTPAKLAACAVLAAVLTAAAGCSGGGDGDKNEKELAAWANKVCTAEVTGKIDASQGALADMASVVKGETPDVLKARLAADVTKLAEADTALANTLDQAGDPKVKNGGAQRAAVSAELRAAATGWMSLRSAFESLPTTDQKTFAEALKALDPEITKYGTSTRTALENLHRGDLGKALGKVPGCAATVPSPAPAPSDGASSPAPGQAAAVQPR
ncbi:MAG: hypothetical protein HOU01_16095, partial [Streptomycetaceae bacterium]|nr:hypothetical protein [Streptomycetaceae bacterium]